MSALEVRGAAKRPSVRPRVLRGVDLDVSASGTLTAVLGPVGLRQDDPAARRRRVRPPRPRHGRRSTTAWSSAARHRRPARAARRRRSCRRRARSSRTSTSPGNVAFGLPRASGAARRRVGGDARARRPRRACATAGPTSSPAGSSSGSPWPGRLRPSPRVVLLDEPFSALDAGLRAQVRNEVRQALPTTGATAIIVTHDQDEALSMADSVAVMDAARSACTARREAGLHRPRRPRRRPLRRPARRAPGPARGHPGTHRAR